MTDTVTHHLVNFNSAICRFNSSIFLSDIYKLFVSILSVKAAGVIHTDFEKGFIRAETISYEDMKKSGSEKAVKEAGLLRSEGREYVMQEGDIVLFRFNV